MSKKTDTLLEVINYETDLLFKFHNNIDTNNYLTHWHYATEIIMPLQKGYKVVVNDHTYVMKVHDILIVPSGERHAMYAPQSPGQRIILQFDLSLLNTVKGLIDASYVYAKPCLITPDAAPEIHAILKLGLLNMLDEYQNRSKFFDASILSHIINMTIQLTRHRYEWANTEDDCDNPAKRREHVAKFNECVEYINENYQTAMTIDTMAYFTGFSKYHFMRWFKQFTNMSFLDYLTQVRVEKAKTMLISTDNPITGIALEAGFQSIATFNRIFKEQNKCTPTEYRHFYNSYEKAKEQAEMKQQNNTEEGGKSDMKKTLKTSAHFLNSYLDTELSNKQKPGSARVTDNIFTNPFIWADIPDPDVISVNGVYYMSSTTMYFTPGVPIMKSYDLVNWQIVNYVYDILDDSDNMSLRNEEHAYGKGSWASSLRYHNGIFYVSFMAYNTKKTYIFKTADIENGPWERYVIKGIYHDMSLLFDDDGRVYMVYGAGKIRIVELTADASSIKEGGLNSTIIEDTSVGGKGGLPPEGAHIYKLNGYYYIFLIAWPKSGSARRIELCYRSKHIEGPYEGKVILDDDIGFKNAGVAQGGIVEAFDGKWYAMLFQDHGSVGRIPVIVPVTWENDWPVFGIDGAVPKQMPLPSIDSGIDRKTYSVVSSDEFYQSSWKKNYSSVNDNSYKYCYPVEKMFSEKKLSEKNSFGKKVLAEESEPDIELIENGNFEDGIKHWSFTDITKLSVVDGENNSRCMFVSGRVTTVSGPKQDLTGKVKRGGVYEVTAEVKYDSGPDTKVFNLCIRNGVSWEGIHIMCSARINKGEWGIIKGTYSLPFDADLSETAVFIETPWQEKPIKDIDLIDFYIKNVSVVSKPLTRYGRTVQGENDYNGSNLAPEWQWNHNPDNNNWSLTERLGYLRLRTRCLSNTLTEARNTLTQRTFGPECSGMTAIELAGMKDGDTTGLAALQDHYGYVGVKMINGQKFVVMVNASSGYAQEIESVQIDQERIYLCVDFDYKDAIDKARFFYSRDGINWTAIGDELNMSYRLIHFTGYRFALFYFSAQVAGGYVDFDYFRVSDMLMKDDSTAIELIASFGNTPEVAGLCGTNIEIPITLEALPAGEYTGIYISMPIPEYFDVSDIIFCTDNIVGSQSYKYDGNRLEISVEGSNVSVINKTSDLFAVLQLRVSGYASEDTTVTLRPDYIAVKGGNVVYNIHNMKTDITLKYVDVGTKAKKLGCSNPLISHKFGADPYTLEYNGRLYMYLTSDAYEYDDYGKLINNTYGKINTLTVISSSDLVNWTDHGEIPVAGVNSAAKWAVHSWAPAIAHKVIDGKDKFFLYFANDASGIGVLEAESPVGPWIDPIGEPIIKRSTPGVEGVVWCFDPAVLVDDDGESYLYFGGGLPSNSAEHALHPKTARVIRLSENMVNTVGRAELIDAPALFEDSGINKINGKYYYSYCSNFVGPRPDGYPNHGEIAYMTSDNPMGPFKYEGTFLKNPSYYFGVGGNNHHCVFTFKGNWYIAYHAQTLANAHGKAKGYRSPHINKLEFFEHGEIKVVEADMKGVSLAAAIDPYQKNDAASFAWSAGITTGTLAEPSDNGKTMYVTEIHDGDWLAVANVDFGETGACKFTACVSSVTGGTITVRIDSPQGEIIGELGVGKTGGELNWTQKSCGVKPVKGIRNIFFIFGGDSCGNLFNFNYWSFDKREDL